MRYAIVLLLLLALVGCKKKDDPAKDAPKEGGADVPGKDKDHIRFRPKEGSSTILGKARDRALDTEIIHEMGQVRLALMTDYPGGQGPPNKDAWLKLMSGLRTLPKLLSADDLVAFYNVRLGNANTVLLYEKRIEEDDDGIVMTADGTARRINKADFEKLMKPK